MVTQRSAAAATAAAAAAAAAAAFGIRTKPIKHLLKNRASLSRDLHLLTSLPMLEQRHWHSAF